jgi:DNA-directed RNA polymerase sigma subunit (sigma70/sigma32)
MEYEVVPGVEMTLEEIAHVAGVSKARIGQIYDVALRKLCRDAARRLMAEYR